MTDTLGDTSLTGFILVSLIVLLIPGPGVLYVVARSLGQGYTASLISAAGLSAGVLVHVLAAVIGLSAILLTSATAFATVKFLGAAYLIYLGIQTIRSKGNLEHTAPVVQQPLRNLFWDGLVVSALNPKIAVFFLAFLPQFVSSEAPSPTSQILLLGLLYACLAFLTDSCYGLLAASLRSKLIQRPSYGRIFQIISGSLMIGLGLKAALTSQRT